MHVCGGLELLALTMGLLLHFAGQQLRLVSVGKSGSEATPTSMVLVACKRASFACSHDHAAKPSPCHRPVRDPYYVGRQCKRRSGELLSSKGMIH